MSNTLQAVKKEVELYTAPDGVKFLDKKEAEFYIAKLSEFVLKYSTYRLRTDWVRDEKDATKMGYAKEILVLVDKSIDENTNIFTISNVLTEALNTVPYTVLKGDNQLSSNFELMLEVPRVDDLDKVESWSKVHEVANLFLDNDILRTAENENLEPQNRDDISSQYATLILSTDTLSEDQQEDDVADIAITCFKVTDSSYMRNILRIIAGDKPYVSTNLVK